MHIGWIGTGVMGASMAGHLLDAGYSLSIHTRTREKASSLLERGASWADSPAAVAAEADVVLSMVGLPSDVESVHLGRDGTLAASEPPAVLIDMTTSRPSLAREIHAAAASKGIESIDAPVSGGDVGARNATLSIMVGADADAFERVRPLMDHMGTTVVRQGGPGAGQHAKMVNQILIAGTMIGVSEGLLYARRAGLDLQTVVTSVGCGAAGSWTIENLVPRIITQEYGPGFMIEHFVKDLGIALDEAKAMELDLPGLAMAHRLYDEARRSGMGRLGTHALILLLEKIHAERPSGAGLEKT